MKKQRPRTTSTGPLRSDGFQKYPVRMGSRPASAREKFESNNHKRNEEAWKHEEMLANVNEMKRREWQAQFYTSLAYKKRNIADISWTEIEEREKKLNERREKLRKLFAEDQKKYEKEREEKLEASKRTLASNLSDPEIERLRCRLNELKRQNEEERKKLSEKLSYESWKKNNPELRQMESERFNKFVREAWIDQKQWREEERRAREEERAKYEREEEEKRIMEEEEEKRWEERIKEKRLLWRGKLEEQIQELKKGEEEEEINRRKEMALEKEKLRLQDIIQKREKIVEERKRKNLELFWAKQHQLKLKKKSICVQEELLEDEMLLKDLLRSYEKDSATNEQRELQKEGEWMKSILEEQKTLEKLREKEYELLFSEEAERMWLKREAEWQGEQRARDKLMKEVMTGLQNQVKEKLSSMQREIEARKTEKENLITSIEESQTQLEKADKTEHHEREYMKIIPNLPLESQRDIRRQELLIDRQIEERQLEIARLEEEMRKIWHGSYALPKYGRKKVDW